jgi:hypothetical protein
MKKISVGLLELETAVLECFLEKTPLNSLGVKNFHHSNGITAPHFEDYCYYIFP